MFARLVTVTSVLVAAACFAVAAEPPAHPTFRVAVYIPVGIVEQMKDPAWLKRTWTEISSQVKVDRVYIESYRSGVTADEKLLEQVKAFFAAQGVETWGGIAYAGSGDTAGFAPGEAEPGQFVSLVYTDPKQREYVKQIAEETARHFDGIILDDFFFNNTKMDSDIRAKGSQSWPEFRLKLMDEVAKDLVLGPARAVNPKVKVVIKFPNWYEHFPENGYDLAVEPKLFDGIYTGNETRDGEITDQHLQPYESFAIQRYFDHVAPGKNGGGWIDTYDIRYADRYAEQLWETVLAGAGEITLFQYGDLTRAAELGKRQAWEGEQTSFTASGLTAWRARSGQTGAPTWATAAGYALDAADRVLGKLGKPVGMLSYKPVGSNGEDFLQDTLGMVGLPMEMVPEFPKGARMVLLTEASAADKDLVAKIKGNLEQGGRVVLTSGLVAKLQDKGLGEIADIRMTGHVLKVTNYWGASGAGAGAALGETQEVLFPEVAFMTNDAWPVVRGTASGRGAPLLVEDRYSKGVLYVLTVPENPAELEKLPQETLGAIRHYLLAELGMELDAPGGVSLYPYDNGSFVVENFRGDGAEVRVTLPGAARLKNLATGEEVAGEAGKKAGTVFRMRVPAHSFVGLGAP